MSDRSALGIRATGLKGSAPLLVLLGLACVLPQGCSSRAQRGTLTPSDAEFKLRTDELAKAYQSLDIKRIKSFYASDTYSLSFDLPYSFDTGAQAKEQRVQRFIDRLQRVVVTPGPDVEVWRENDRVWTTRSFKVAGGFKDGESFNFEGMFSAIWEKHDDKWLIAYEHFWGPWAREHPTPTPTPVPRFPPPPPPPPPVPSLDELNDVFFDLDKWDIRPDQIPTLTADALLLKQHPTAVVAIEGRCDERASVGYNRVLGQKRAEETKKYLVSLGIEPERLQAVSVGKLPPFVAGTGETVWSQNRRAHFVVLKK
jgi:outer membrane protein OmpA-like peptidoglycan-associated protein